MEITDKLVKQLTEAKYLDVENTKRYRPILRFFYLQYEKINYMLYKEDVYHELKGKMYFEEYTMEMCEQDLSCLVEWRNLVALQDTSTAMTIEQFKNKRFRYQLNDFSVEIERLVIKLENLYIEGSSLEPTLVERIKDEILKVDKAVEKKIEVSGWWKGLNNDFKLLNENYKDYIRDFYTTKLEEFAKTDEFIKQKDVLVNYLRNFISALQRNTYLIEGKLKELTKEDEQKLLQNILETQKNIVRLDNKSDNITDEEYIESNEEKWKNLKSWFIGTPKKPESEIHRIYEITNDIIQKITRYASQIIEAKGNVSTRKEEYRKICELFCHVNGAEEAHKLSSIVFGIFKSKHIRGNFERISDSININIAEELPQITVIKPRTRNYHEKKIKIAIEDKTFQKEKMKQEYNEQIRKEQDALNSYIVDGKIVIESLPQIETTVRKTLLKWISKAFSVEGRVVKTEDGRKIKLVFPEGNRQCLLNCEDGIMQMPAYVIEFFE